MRRLHACQAIFLCIIFSSFSPFSFVFCLFFSLSRYFISFLSFVVVPPSIFRTYSLFLLRKVASAAFAGAVYLHIKRFFMNSVCQHCPSRSFLRELFCSQFFLVCFCLFKHKTVGQKPNDHTTLKKYQLKEKNVWLFFRRVVFNVFPKNSQYTKKPHG